MHFSQLCNDESFLNIESFENDCQRLAELSGGIFADIRILGGEPLLHPDVNQILKTVRSFFPIPEYTDELGKIIIGYF
jgi:ABC-2 type transport system ATP-binding protein